MKSFVLIAIQYCAFRAPIHQIKYFWRGIIFFCIYITQLMRSWHYSNGWNEFVFLWRTSSWNDCHFLSLSLSLPLFPSIALYIYLYISFNRSPLESELFVVIVSWSLTMVLLSIGKLTLYWNKRNDNSMCLYKCGKHCLFEYWFGAWLYNMCLARKKNVYINKWRSLAREESRTQI